MYKYGIILVLKATFHKCVYQVGFPSTYINVKMGHFRMPFTLVKSLELFILKNKKTNK